MGPNIPDIPDIDVPAVVSDEKIDNKGIDRANWVEKNDEKDGHEEAVDEIGKKAEIDFSKVNPKHKAEIVKILVQRGFGDSPDILDSNPDAIRVATAQLREWGYTPNDIDKSSVVLDSETAKRAAEINELVRQGKMPSVYGTNVGIYGFKGSFNEKEGTLSYVRSAFDHAMNGIENLLRVSGDRGGNILTSLWRSGERKKISVDEMEANIKELGLESYYKVGQVDGKITITEDVSDLKKGAFFIDDLLRYDKNPYLSAYDKTEALEMAVKMVEHSHITTGRGFGELLGNNLVIQVDGEKRIAGARISQPFSRYSKEVPVVDQKAKDILDLCFSVSSAGYQGENSKGSRDHLLAILNTYQDPAVKQRIVEMVKSGLPNSTIHNDTRFGFDRVKDKSKAYEGIRKDIVEIAGVKG